MPLRRVSPASYPETSSRTELPELGLSGASIRTIGEQASHGRVYLVAVGAVLTLWFSVGAVRALRVSSAIAWRVPLSRAPRLIASGVVFTVGIVTFALLGLLARAAGQHMEPAGFVPTLLLVVVYAASGLWVMEKLPRPEEATWRDLLPGAALFAVSMEAYHLVVVLYLTPRLSSSTELYGTLGTAAVLLVGFYLVARVFVLVLFLNARLYWDEKAHKDQKPGAT